MPSHNLLAPSNPVKKKVRFEFEALLSVGIITMLVVTREKKRPEKQAATRNAQSGAAKNKTPSPPLGPGPLPLSPFLHVHLHPQTFDPVDMHRSQSTRDAPLRPLKPRAKARPGDPFRGQTTGNSSTGREEGAVMMFAGEVDRRGERESSGEGGGAERPKEWPRS